MVKILEKRFYLHCLFTLTVYFFPRLSQGAELDERLQLWEKNAPYCNGHLSKISIENPNNTCDDGDSVLFAGLLCGAGDSRGCRTVEQSLDHNGRWFRSPRRVNAPNGSEENSFSPDMALGAQLYLTKQNQLASGRLWFQWLDDNTPCTVYNKDHTCKFRKYPRFCLDDTNNGCIMQPHHLAILAETRRKLGIQSPPNSPCPQSKKTIDEIWSIYLSPWNYSRGLFYLTDVTCGVAPDFNDLAAQVNKEGYSLHLVAAEIFLLRLMGRASESLKSSAEMLVRRQPQNPFFLYLRDGPTDEVLQKTLALCPKDQEQIDRSHKSEWAWERSDSQRAWQDTMLWDCIFMAKLLQDQSN